MSYRHKAKSKFYSFGKNETFCLSLLRVAVKRISLLMARIHIRATYVNELKVKCKKYFNCYALFLQTVTPTVWNIEHAVPFHAEKILNEFGLSLGLNTMQGRGAKHVKIAMYASHYTLSNRWEKVFKHEFLNVIWLRKKDP